MRWFTKRKLHTATLPLYTVINKNNPENYLTITLTKNEALEYASQKIKIDRYSHFTLWCNLRNYDVNDKTAWDDYFNNCITLDEKNEYLIQQVNYRYTDIVAIMRMFGYCIPIGCSFDTPIETSFLSSLISIKNIIDKKETSDGE